MRSKRSTSSFLAGMLLFFMCLGFAIVTLVDSFTGTNAFEVFVNFIFGMTFTAIAYFGFLVAADGWED